MCTEYSTTAIIDQIEKTLFGCNKVFPPSEVTFVHSVRCIYPLTFLEVNSDSNMLTKQIQIVMVLKSLGSEVSL